MSNWYYAQNNQQQGPVNEAELKEMLATGKIASTTLVWKDGMANWTMASSLPEFQFRPPPMPSTAAPKIPPITPGAEAAAPAATPVTPVDTSLGDANAVDQTASFDQADIDKNKVFAVIGYLWILFLVPLLAAKDSPFAKYHANQGLILFICWIIASSIHMIPFIGGLVGLVASLACLVLMIMGILNAAQGQAKPLPYIGQYKILT